MAGLGIVVILDFYKTIIDVDSDYWVVKELGLTDFFYQLLPTMPLNSAMAEMMKELYSRGKTIKQIVQVLERVPIHPRIVHALKSARALGCELRIVSDANTFFIDTILEHVGLRDCFSEINTNPGFVDEEGRLNIFPFHDSGCCSLCPPNMCKGRIIENPNIFIQGGEQRIIYLGDGAGDYCPGLKLTHADYMMPRKNFPVWDLICGNPTPIRADIHEWTNGEEFERVLLRIIDSISMNESAQFSTDSKLMPIPIPAHEALPRQ
ncbi:inorganic pyrophosphatase 2 [Ricinus communis]|uniref:Phosphoethanolamine/phosphocholine phosphatase, putative n=1 Tax=Ricinus communis TaxID=3988 RepID=B9T693_RICCO|nr:inorganic pyrophosphatase 2 [Ricinus communis]EEF28621.1 Phosphoethanolamine/phosphocholine phosphatase, putative [Ricinus communis]|eukprot:XP_002533762.1 inorganic pyrophosphatase 2 [Ricinus communis]